MRSAGLACALASCGLGAWGCDAVPLRFSTFASTLTLSLTSALRLRRVECPEASRNRATALVPCPVSNACPLPQLQHIVQTVGL